MILFGKIVELDDVGDGRVVLLLSPVLLDVIDCTCTASSLVEPDVDDDVAVEVEFEVNCFVVIIPGRIGAMLPFKI